MYGLRDPFQATIDSASAEERANREHLVALKETAQHEQLLGINALLNDLAPINRLPV